MNPSEHQSPFWNEQNYLNLNPDVSAAVATGNQPSGLNHYLEFGAWEKRNNGARFNSNTYLNQYLDVATAVGKGEFGSAFHHFLLYGQYEGRTATQEQNFKLLSTQDPGADLVTGTIANGPIDKQYSRISDDLLDLAQQLANPAQTNNIGTLKKNNNLLNVNSAGTEVTVRITAIDVNSLLPSLKSLGFKTIASQPNLHFVEGTIPIAALTNTESLANQGLLGVMPVYRPKTNKGLVTSQADFVLETDRVRATIPPAYDGTGVKIGVLSDSYNNLGGASADIASSDLPAAGVQVLQDAASGGSDEGRAMLQLIHDLAPGSPLAFATAYNSEADFAQNIRDLADPAIGNAKIIVDDITYFAEPFYQDGIIAQAVDDVVTNRGASYFSSAGNYAKQAYESTQAYAPGTLNFVNDAALDAAIGTSATYYDFDSGAGTDTRQRITFGAGQSILLSLQWDDPFYTAGGVDTDLDIYLLSTSGAVLLKATTNNIANQTPVEIFSAANGGSSSVSADLVIRKRTGPNPGRFKYLNFNSGTFNEYAPNSSTITPHAGAANGIAVAAAPFFNQTVPESYTSVGPTTILFNPDGTAKATPEVRSKPDITAIDGTDTTFFSGGLSNDDTPSYPNFFGTSAAAPHAAAVAALVKQANPNFTPAQIYTRLKTTAKDIGAVGVDNVTGSGLINAYDAIFGPATPATLNFSDGLETNVLSSSYETNSTGAGRIQVRTTNSPATGTRHLTMDSSRNGTNGLNEAILHVNTTGQTNLNLSFDQKEFNDTNNLMPTTFTGSSNSDGVALSVDGTNWYRLFNLGNATSTNTYQNKSINLSNFAATNSLTLGSDVQIKFQQYGNNSIASGNGGFAFDNIAVTGVVVSPPAIDLNGPAAGINYNTTFNRGGGAVKIVDSANLTVTDDSDTINSASVTISNPINSPSEILAVDNALAASLGIGVDYTGGVLNLTGNKTKAQYQQLLRTVTYNNTFFLPNNSDRTINFIINDGTANSPAATTTLTVNSPPPIDLGNVTNKITRPPIDSVSNINIDDILSFNLTANTRLIAELTNSGGNADIALYSSSTILATSTNTDTASERIDYSTLIPGSYYLRVYQASPGSTINYRLRLSAINV